MTHMLFVSEVGLNRLLYVQSPTVGEECGFHRTRTLTHKRNPAMRPSSNCAAMPLLLKRETALSSATNGGSSWLSPFMQCFYGFRSQLYCMTSQREVIYFKGESPNVN